MIDKYLTADICDVNIEVDTPNFVVMTEDGGDGWDNILPRGYKNVDYIEFSGEQIVDTGVILNQNSKIRVLFTRERQTQHYLYGVASSDNTASVTAYLGGSWRFGDKTSTKSISTSEDMVYSGFVDSQKIAVTGSASTIGQVNDFETIGSLIIGGCRGSNGGIGDPQFVGKIYIFLICEGEKQILKLIPVTDGNLYRFYDVIGKKFHDSITGTALRGGNL